MKNIPQHSNSIFLFIQFNIHFRDKYKLLNCALFFIILISVPQAIFAQLDCTAPDTTLTEDFNYSISSMSATGPYYIRIYVHVIRDGEGNGGESVDAIYNALEDMYANFEPHDIFFVWDCVINYIDSDIHYPDPIGFLEIIYNNDDGVDIYIYPDYADSEGIIGWGDDTYIYIIGSIPNFGPTIQSHTLSHEMGHVLGLSHTHHGCEYDGIFEYPNGSQDCTLVGDYVCDTPPDPNLRFNSSYIDFETCEYLDDGDCILPSDPPVSYSDFDPDVHNIMSFTWFSCMQHFTEGQGQRMRNTIETLPILQPTIVENVPCPCWRDIHITENTVYGDDLDITSNIIVHPGAQLTVTAKLRFAEGYGIIVEPNGRLLVNGGHITNLCEGPWQGIVVIGDSDENQFPYNGNGDLYQGKVEIKNDAIIENAITGVSLFDIDNPTGTAGGIVIATNSTFKNCGQAVHFKPYTNNYSIGNPLHNFSYFKDCTFTVDDDILTNFYQHLYLEGVSGIRIIACDLENTKDPGVYYRGKGIYSIDANFIIEGKCVSGSPCSEWKPPTVKGFSQGVNAVNTGLSLHTYRVDRTVFDNNFIGVYSVAVNNPRIVRSDFKVGQTGAYIFPARGIHIYGGTGYTVENNDFEGYGSSNSSIGILVSATGNDNNQIYKNTFDGTYIANLSNGDNRNEFNAFHGLHYFCNENENNIFDFCVVEESGFTNGIAQNQGFYHEAAGNKFSFYPGENESDFFNHSAWTVNYFYDAGDADQIPEDVSDFVNPIEADDGNTCTVNFPDGPEGPQLPGKISRFNEHSGLYDGRVAQRDALIDDGDTPSLVNTINNFQSAGTQLKADLLDISPYLSYNALLAAADRYDILSHADVYDIMVANPDESRQEPLLEYLETKTNPMPSNMVDSLRNQPFTVTARTILENQIAYHAVEKENAANFILHHYLTDTTGLQMDSILFWLDNKGGLTSEYVKVDAFLHDRDTTAAIQQLDSIAQNYTLSADQATELGYFSDLKHLQVNLLRGGRTILECDSAEVEELVEIAGSSRWLAGQQAQNILNFGYGHDTIPAPILPELSGGVRLADQQMKTNAPSVIYAFPNPADNLVTFQYSLPEADARCFIQVFDRYGRKVITLPAPKKQGFVDWNTNDVREGLYFYSITNGKKVIGSGKVVIAH
jgi:hypothetical protein